MGAGLDSHGNQLHLLEKNHSVLGGWGFMSASPSCSPYICGQSFRLRLEASSYSGKVVPGSQAQGIKHKTQKKRDRLESQDCYLIWGSLFTSQDLRFLTISKDLGIHISTCLYMRRWGRGNHTRRLFFWENWENSEYEWSIRWYLSIINIVVIMTWMYVRKWLFFRDIYINIRGKITCNLVLKYFRKSGGE